MLKNKNNKDQQLIHWLILLEKVIRMLMLLQEEYSIIIKDIVKYLKNQKEKVLWDHSFSYQH